MRRSSLLFFCLLATGCTVGPNQVPPRLDQAQGPWLNAVGQGAVADRWWAQLGDAGLDALVERALTANLDLREAEARLREARANRDAAIGRTAPELRVGGSAVEQQVSANGQLPVNNIPGFQRSFSLFDVGFDAAWEIDLWGANRRSVEAASARAAQAQAGLAAVRLATVAEMVRNYADLRSAQRRGQLLGEEAELRGAVAALAEQRFRGGESSRLEWDTARQRAATARAAVGEADVAAKAAAYRLALLTGQPPEAVQPLAETPAPLPDAPAIVAAGVRSELLQRRPDIAAAEADLIAANADVGVQTAQLYPRFSLTGGIGQQARKAGDLADGASTRFSIGPSFSWPIFSFGRIAAQIKAADARTQQAQARYEKAVLGALAESEGAANRYARSGSALDERRGARDAAQKAADLAQLRFEHGEDDRLQMLEARSAAIAAAQLEVAAASERVQAFAALSKALAGGTGSGSTKP